MRQQLEIVLDHLGALGVFSYRQIVALAVPLTSSDGSDSVLSKAGNVPLSLDRIYTCQSHLSPVLSIPNHFQTLLLTLFGAFRCNINNHSKAAILVSA